MGVLDYDTTASNNTAISGIGILGSNKVLNFDNALRQALADTAASITRPVTKSSGPQTAVKADHMQLWRCTATLTINLTAAATLTSGWQLIVFADGGTVTIDPNSSETINGAATFTIPDGDKAVIICDGSGFYALGAVGLLAANNLSDIDDADEARANLSAITLSDVENRIINGAFDFWQRGTSQTAAGYGSADRWLNGAVGGTVTMSRQDFAVGTKVGKNNPRFFCRQAVSGQSAAGHFALRSQRIEDVRSFAGETITVLGWARRASGSGKLVCEARQSFGTGGSPSAAVTGISITDIALTGDLVPFAWVVEVPSITGKTLGTNSNDFLELNFWASAGSDYNARTDSLGIQTIGVDLWGVHIRRGAHGVDAVEEYIAPELGPEEERCRRFYRAVPVSSLSGGIASSSYQWNEPLAPVMRATPVATLLTAGTLINLPSLSASPTTRDVIFVGTAGSTGITGVFDRVYGLDAEL